MEMALVAEAGIGVRGESLNQEELEALEDELVNELEILGGRLMIKYPKLQFIVNYP